MLSLEDTLADTVIEWVEPLLVLSFESSAPPELFVDDYAGETSDLIEAAASLIRIARNVAQARRVSDWGSWVELVGFLGSCFSNGASPVGDAISRLLSSLSGQWLLAYHPIALEVLQTLRLCQTRLDISAPYSSVVNIDWRAVERLVREPKSYATEVLFGSLGTADAQLIYFVANVLPVAARILELSGLRVQRRYEQRGIDVTFGRSALQGTVSFDVLENGEVAVSSQSRLQSRVVLSGWTVAVDLSVDSGSLTIGRSEQEQLPLIRLGVPGAGLQLQTVEIAAAFQSRPRPSWCFHVKFQDVRVGIIGGSSDGFSSSIVGSHSLGAAFDIDLEAFSTGQVRFSANGGVDGSVAASIQVGPLTIQTFRIALRVVADGVVGTSALDFVVSLGPVLVCVRNLGFCLRLSALSGDLGNLGVDAVAKFPDGIVLSISAGPVRGGGYIAYDEPLGRYTGALALSIGSVALRAVGILDTRAPGVSGYSFLIVISAEFTPIQLGFGFTLNGVGGLCGIQRSVSVSALQAGVRDGSLTPLLFARDPIAQASQLVTGLQRIFPPTNDRYVFGPMFKLGWGTPTLITADLGIVLQVPSPIVIALLGTVSATLPKPEAAVVVLNIDIVGVLEVTEKRLSIDASLRDSRVAAFTLTGDMALRFSWGDAPDFALSVGGFNPAFRPPTGFPTLRRLSLALGSGANPRLSLAAYFALTSNSLQFGARAELYATALGFTVQGYLEFHALFIFRPFSFQFDFAAGLSLKRGNSVLAAITVTGQLKGPRPWYVKATASITVLFFDVSVNIERTFGEAATPELATPVDVWTRLVPALEDVRNWSATLPGGRSRGVSTAADRETPPRVRLDPMSQLAVRQKVLPLDRRITKLGEAVIGPPARFSIRAVRAGTGAGGEGGAPLATSAVNEPFAAAQYQALTDAERLSSPSFQPMAAGVEALGASVRAGGSLRTPVQWRTLLLEPQAGDDARAARGVPARMAGKMGAVDASKDAGLRATGMERFAPPEAAEPSATLEPERWTLASTRDLGARTGTEPSAAWGTSTEAMREAPAGERGRWQVVPSWEVRR